MITEAIPVDTPRSTSEGRDGASTRWRRSVWGVAAVVAILEICANVAALSLVDPADESVLVETFGPAGNVMFRYMQFEMHVDALIFLAAVGVGALIVSRYPRHGFGWVFGVGWGLALTGLHLSMVGASLAATSSNVLAATWLMWTMSCFDSVTLITIPLALILYPTGRSIGVWWSRILRLFVLIGSALLVLDVFRSGPIDTGLGDTIVENPAGFVDISSGAAFEIFEVAFLVFMAAAMIVRFVRADGVERQQIKWVIAIGIVAILLLTISGLVEDAYPATADTMSIVSGVLGVLAAVAIGMAILKYRLYDIDIVISRSLTYGALAVFITGVYALVVVGVGSLVGGGDEPSLALSIAAVAIVAVAFEPLRRGIQHWANRLVYGKRATPYEVLSGTTARLSGASDPDEALAEITQLLVDGTGASEAVIWLAVGASLLPRAATPSSALSQLSAVDVGDEALEGILGDRVVAVRHRGELLGAMSITKERGDAVSGTDERVLQDVAAGAGGLLRNIVLNAELADRADQLRASRRRLVAAQDTERHRLERDLHDGAQQQVVALKVKLGIASTLANREGADELAAIIADVSETTQDAVDAMRTVAHGIYPPLLEAEGLEAALVAAKRTISVPMEIVSSRVDRYDRGVEQSIYFAILGTVNQAVDAGAKRAIVSLSSSDDTVRFLVDVDARPKDLRQVEDRIEALEGTVTAVSSSSGWMIEGLIPSSIPAMEYA